MILRRKFEDRESVESETGKSPKEDDLESCRTLLEESGKALGRVSISPCPNIRNLPPDQKGGTLEMRRLRDYEGSIHFGGHRTRKSNLVQQPWMDVRFSDLSGESIHSAPRLSDALVPHDSEKPAIKAWYPWFTTCPESIIGWRANLVWVNSEVISSKAEKTAPDEWASDRATSHRGGLAIWEYEQWHGRIGGIRQSIRRTTAGREDADVCQDVPEEDVQQQNFCGALIHGILFGASSLINQFPSILEFVTFCNILLGRVLIIHDLQENVPSA